MDKIFLMSSIQVCGVFWRDISLTIYTKTTENESCIAVLTEKESLKVLTLLVLTILKKSFIHTIFKNHYSNVRQQKVSFIPPPPYFLPVT